MRYIRNLQGNFWNECIIDSGADKTQQAMSRWRKISKSVFIPLSPSHSFLSMEHKWRQEIKVSFTSPFIIYGWWIYYNIWICSSARGWNESDRSSVKQFDSNQTFLLNLDLSLGCEWEEHNPCEKNGERMKNGANGAFNSGEPEHSWAFTISNHVKNIFALF